MAHLHLLTHPTNQPTNQPLKSTGITGASDSVVEYVMRRLHVLHRTDGRLSSFHRFLHHRPHCKGSSIYRETSALDMRPDLKSHSRKNRGFEPGVLFSTAPVTVGTKCLLAGLSKCHDSLVGGKSPP